MKYFFLILLATSLLSFKSNETIETTLSRKHNNNNLITSNKLDTTHKYYVSVSNMKYNAEAKSLQMTTRFFIDDFEDILSAREDRKIALGEASELDGVKQIIARYLDKKLVVKTDDTTQEINYLGAEYEGDQIILYIEIPISQQPKAIEMSFTAFLELFEDQKNLVHCNIAGKRKTLLMHLNKKTDSVKF